MRTVGYIIMQAGQPCTLIVVRPGREGQVLIPGFPIARFSHPRDAHRAIARTVRAAKALRGTMVDEWERLAPLFSGESYVLRSLVHFSTPKKSSEAYNQNRQQTGQLHL